MKLIICGAGRITDELLKRVGPNWQITLIEKQEAKLAPFSNRFPSIVRVLPADASSPVVLEKAGLRQQDGVLAMTNDDQANLAIARFAREADIKTVLAVVRDPEMLPAFQKMDVWTISMATDAARKVYQYVKDPRVRMIHLGEGEGELLELKVGKPSLPRLESIANRRDPEWRKVGLIRANKLLFPDQSDGIAVGDRLLVLGKADLYNRLVSQLAENQLHFPRTYGQEMILGLSNDSALDVAELLNEAFYLAQGTHIERIKIVCGHLSDDTQRVLTRWSESLAIEIIDQVASVKDKLTHVAEQSDAGIVIAPYKQQSFIRAFFGKTMANLAGHLPCPMLSAKLSDPYEHLIVPYNGSLSAQRALEIALDLAHQLDASVAVVIVVEPSYLRGEAAATGAWEQRMLKQVRELSRVHQLQVDEKVRRGNPVKEIAAAAAGSQLLVMGLPESRPGVLSIDTAGLIAEQAPCSVLLIP